MMDPTSALEWSEEGSLTIDLTGATPTIALESTLNAILAATRSRVGRATPAGSRSVPIRAEGDDLAEVLKRLIESLFEQVDSTPEQLVDVRIDGLLRGDRGLVGWGFARLGTGDESPANALRVDGTPRIRVTEREVSVRLQLVRERTGSPDNPAA